MAVAAPVDHRLHRAAVVGHQLVQGPRQPMGDLELSGPRAAQHDQQGRAGRAEADAGRRGVRLHLALLYGLGHADRRDHLRLHDGLLAGAARQVVRRDHQGVRVFADHHLGDARDRHAHPPLRHRRDARSRIRGNRRALSVLRHAARLARRRAHRLRHRLERAVRQPAEDHRRTARPLADPDGCCQLIRRRDGQDDRRAVDRRRLDRHQLVRPRRHDPALRVLALDRARLSRRRAGDAAGLRVHRNDRDPMNSPAR